jgi:enoyl-CoA hydratase/carnithine racemase
MPMLETSAYEDLDLEQHDHVLVVTLDNPDRMNALSMAMHESLPALWHAVRDEASIRAVVITGAGTRAFCAGMDLKELTDRGQHAPAAPDVHDHMDITPLQCDVWLPVIVAVNGVCAGSGFHFVADADVVVASTDASFVDTHVNVGQVSAVEPITLVPRIGVGNALRMAVLGRGGRVDADEARRIFLVDEVVAPEQLRDRAIELAGFAAAGSPAAIETSKRAIRGALERPRADAMQHGWELLLDFREHPDNVEGPQAFAEKREPKWQ